MPEQNGSKNSDSSVIRVVLEAIRLPLEEISRRVAANREHQDAHNEVVEDVLRKICERIAKLENPAPPAAVPPPSTLDKLTAFLRQWAAVLLALAALAAAIQSWRTARPVVPQSAGTSSTLPDTN